MPAESFYNIDSDPDNAKRIRKERDKARELKRTPWWKNQLHKGTCHYCGHQFSPAQLSMDHIVPLARGGKSTKGNIVPSCVDCNRKKKLETPAENILQDLKASKKISF
ncbi:MAG: HNH endonuclease [Nitrospirae bacterium]|nr:HNH endonuclease [Nitrospirota bacterium]